MDEGHESDLIEVNELNETIEGNSPRKTKVWKNDYDETRRYLPKWENEFKWLTLKDGHCFCKWCDQFVSKKSFKKHRLQAHAKTERHQASQAMIKGETIETYAFETHPFGQLEPTLKASHLNIYPPGYNPKWEKMFKWLTIKGKTCFCKWCNRFLVNEGMRKKKLYEHGQSEDHKKAKMDQRILPRQQQPSTSKLEPLIQIGEYNIQESIEGVYLNSFIYFILMILVFPIIKQILFIKFFI